MGIGNFDANNPIVQLEVMKEKLRSLEEKSYQQGRDLEKAYITVGRLEAELKRAIDERNDLRVTLEVTKRELAHAKEALSQSSQKAANKDKQSK